MVSLPDAIMAVAKPEEMLWYRDKDGAVVSGRPIAADETGVVLSDNTVLSLRHVSLREEDVLRSV